MPPARAIAIAISDSVTVSIAADISGTFSAIPRVKRVDVSTSLGCVGECRGSSSTSSNVRAMASRMRVDGSAPFSPIRDGPLPWSGFAGRDC